MKKIAEMITGVKDIVINLGLSMIAEEWEHYDELLRERKDLRSEWYIVRKDETTLITSLGAVTYHKTLFKNKFTGKSEYLLDRLMGIEKHARLTEDAVAQILEEAVDSSYRKGGEHASITEDIVSKETVMNKLHDLNFPKTKPQDKKKTVKYLYIDADEDHVSSQYLNKKGDIVKPRTNTIMPKIIYVYEGINTENKRHELINKKHFGGVYEGGKNIEELWNEVWEYIEGSYDTEALIKSILTEMEQRG